MRDEIHDEVDRNRVDGVVSRRHDRQINGCCRASNVPPTTR